MSEIDALLANGSRYTAGFSKAGLPAPPARKVAVVACMASAASAQMATGYVYHDANGNQNRDTGEKGLEGIGISNGVDIVQTGANGQYRIAVGDEAVLFVIKPSGWSTQVDPKLQLPRFYYSHKPLGSPESRFPGVAPTGALPASVDFPPPLGPTTASASPRGSSRSMPSRAYPSSRRGVGGSPFSASFAAL